MNPRRLRIPDGTELNGGLDMDPIEIITRAAARWVAVGTVAIGVYACLDAALYGLAALSGWIVQ